MVIGPMLNQPLLIRVIKIAMRGHRLTGESCGAENAPSRPADTPGPHGPRRSFNDSALLFLVFQMPQIGGPPPIEGIGGGPSAREPISPVHDHDVGVGADRDR